MTKQATARIERFKKMKQVGSVAPSSSFLINKMLADIDFSKDLNILELGAGDGVFTKALLERSTINSKIESYEINNVFIEVLNKIQDKRLTIKGECVSTIKEYSNQQFDVILSSLPLANLNKTLKEEFLNQSKRLLKEDGIFLQYQYLPTDFSRIKSVFGKAKLKFCFLNLPPAFIYQVKQN